MTVVPDPTQPAAPAGAAPAAAPPAAAPAQAQPAAEASQAPAPPRRANPYARLPGEAAKPAPTTPAAGTSPPAGATPGQEPAPKQSNRSLLKATRDLRARDEELTRLRPIAEEASADRKALATFAESQLAALPEGWREHVVEVAGDSPRAQLSTIASLQKRGLLQPQGSPVGATTAPPAGSAPPAPKVDVDPDVKAARHVDALREKGKTTAARVFETMHSAAVARGRQKLGSAAPTKH